MSEPLHGQRRDAISRETQGVIHGVGRVQLRWTAGVLGMSGLLAQQLLLRELLIVFAGNELTIGLILACWLATQSAGSLWARRLGRGGSDTIALKHFLLISLVFCLSLLPAIYAARLIKPVLGLSVGTVVGLGAAGVASLVILTPVSLTHGAMFTLGCDLWYRSTLAGMASSKHTAAGNIYILTTVGTLVAGLLWTLALIRLPDPFQVATGLIFLNAVIVLYLARPLQVGFTLWCLAALVLIASSLLVLITGTTRLLHQSSIASLWQHQNILHYENSMHGNIVITENQGQYAFFSDGTPAFMAPVPDLSLVESTVHIPMTAHPSPQNILLIGGGAVGFVEAILQHPTVSNLEYLELDPSLLQVQRDLQPKDGMNGLYDPRVRLHAYDARTWLQAGASRYDVIFSRYHDPDNLHSSRYFTVEFFRLAANSLRDQGVLVLGFPGLVGHLNEPLRDLAAGVFFTLRQVFPSVRAFPGEGHSFLVASFDPGITGLDPEGFADRLWQRGLLETLALPWDVEQRLHPRWHAWFEEFIATGEARLLHDFWPRALFLSVAHWSTLNAPLTAYALQAVYNLNPALLVVGVLLILLLSALALNRLSPMRKIRAIPAVLTTGFCAMLVNLSLLFTFQILVGRLFGWLGLLTAAFMAGLGAGALYTSRRLGQKNSSPGALHRLLLQTDIVVLLFISVLLVSLPFTAPQIAPLIPPTVLRAFFFPLLLVSGAVCGAQFPVASSLLARANNHSVAPQKPGGDPSGGGIVYSADLLGGCLGGILGGIVLLPLFGVAGAGVIVGLLKVVTVILLLRPSQNLSMEVES